ncbi:MAG: hypothetical protein BZ136_07405 [Methanosphaera sp. rholeuAM74]|nr:MAG: hypothetical protein BZ136_07405 [Methanosphaera sp. rholeuAM74]
MSIHLQSVPLPMDRIDNAMNINDLSSNSSGNDFKIRTQMKDMDVMEDILENKLLGFKNKRQLVNFQNQGEMLFYKLESEYIEILFMGNFQKDQTINFINHLNYEYLSQTNNINAYREIVNDYTETSIEEVKEKVAQPKPKFSISTNMKNMSIIDSIRTESYLGYNSMDELDRFLSKGEIALKKTENGTYDIVFIGNFDKAEAKSYVENLSDEYALKVQELTYMKVIEKLKEKNYSLESEVIDNNDSIVLTVNMK